MPATADLRRQLTNFAEAIEAAAQANPFVDRAAVRRICDGLSAVLDEWERLDNRQQARVIDTVSYVTDPDDDEHDVLSPIGLMDDEEKVAELLHELGL